MVEISVIIPTYNRLATLERCLAALEEQTLNRPRYEIIVVDDASSDGTGAAIAARPGVSAICQSQSSGPAAARNVGIRAAGGRLVLLLGDDAIARPPLLEQHLAAHARVRGEHVAVLGCTRWAEVPAVSPFMRCLADGRAFPQFRYRAIADPDDVPLGFFQACNVSLSRTFLLRHGLFDEDFRQACGDASELAYRLRRHGLRLVFRKEIVADRRRPTSYRSACRHSRTAGAVALLMVHKHPELAEASSLAADRSAQRAANWIERHATEAIVDPLLELADRRRWDHPLLARAYDWALRKHQLWGRLDAAAQAGRRS
jgi:glycosyltransferase involved in cell wall biosynthesis